MKHTIFSLGLCGLLALLAPTTTSAYYTTAQEAFRLSDSLALFAITYQFGVAGALTELPTQAERTGLINNTDVVTYSVLASEIGVTDAGKTQAMIVSNAPVADEQYQVSGLARSFTLYVALELDADDPMAKYQVQVDSLPYTVTRGDGPAEQRGLNQYELAAYLTPKTGLNANR